MFLSAVAAARAGSGGVRRVRAVGALAAPSGMPWQRLVGSAALACRRGDILPEGAVPGRAFQVPPALPHPLPSPGIESPSIPRIGAGFLQVLCSRKFRYLPALSGHWESPASRRRRLSHALRQDAVVGLLPSLKHGQIAAGAAPHPIAYDSWYRSGVNMQVDSLRGVGRRGLTSSTGILKVL